MTKRTSTQQTQLYIIFWMIIIGLVVLIGWFAYLLIRPDTATETTESTNQQNVTTTANTTNENKQKKKKNNENANNAVTENTTVTENETANVNETTNENTNSDGLVEPDGDTEDDDGTKTVTLYFPKADSDCGEVYPVERKIEPSDDLYGQIILEDMHGPTAEEGDYTNAVVGIRLRQVEYTTDGPLITLNEGYDELDECQQATVDAQLIKTANAMFELPEDTAGQVVVGVVEEADSASEDTTDTSEDSE